MPVFPRRRQTDRRNDRDRDPALNSAQQMPHTHTQGRPHRLASCCCCCTNIESGTSISAEGILLGSPGGRSRGLNWPKCFTHTWSLTEPMAQTSSSTHAHTRSPSCSVRKEKTEVYKLKGVVTVLKWVQVHFAEVHLINTETTNALLYPIEFGSNLEERQKPPFQGIPTFTNISRTAELARSPLLVLEAHTRLAFFAQKLITAVFLNLFSLCCCPFLLFSVSCILCGGKELS